MPTGKNLEDTILAINIIHLVLSKQDLSFILSADDIQFTLEAVGLSPHMHLWGRSLVLLTISMDERKRSIISTLRNPQWYLCTKWSSVIFILTLEHLLRFILLTPQTSQTTSNICICG